MQETMVKLLGQEDLLEKGEDTPLLLQYCWASLLAQLVKKPHDPWVGKIPWRREKLPTPIVRPGELHGLYSPWGYIESYRTEGLSPSLSLNGF